MGTSLRVALAACGMVVLTGCGGTAPKTAPVTGVVTLGGAPLAQGTVYLLLSKKTAHILTALLVSFVVVASVAVILSPIDYSQVEAHRLTGRVFAWQWCGPSAPSSTSTRWCS